MSNMIPQPPPVPSRQLAKLARHILDPLVNEAITCRLGQHTATEILDALCALHSLSRRDCDYTSGAIGPAYTAYYHARKVHDAVFYLQALAQAVPSTPIRTIVDLGAGTGAVLWAAVFHRFLGFGPLAADKLRIICVEPAGPMRCEGEHLWRALCTRCADVPARVDAEWVSSADPQWSNSLGAGVAVVSACRLSWADARLADSAGPELLRSKSWVDLRDTILAVKPDTVIEWCPPHKGRTYIRGVRAAVAGCGFFVPQPVLPAFEHWGYGRDAGVQSEEALRLLVNAKLDSLPEAEQCVRRHDVEAALSKHLWLCREPAGDWFVAHRRHDWVALGE